MIVGHITMSPMPTCSRECRLACQKLDRQRGHGLRMRLLGSSDVGQRSQLHGSAGALDVKGHQCRWTSTTSAPPQVYPIRFKASL